MRPYRLVYTTRRRRVIITETRTKARTTYVCAAEKINAKNSQISEKALVRGRERRTVRIILSQQSPGAKTLNDSEK